jgi:hypothetical protein
LSGFEYNIESIIVEVLEEVFLIIEGFERDESFERVRNTTIVINEELWILPAFHNLFYNFLL